MCVCVCAYLDTLQTCQEVVQMEEDQVCRKVPAQCESVLQQREYHQIQWNCLELRRITGSDLSTVLKICHLGLWNDSEHYSTHEPQQQKSPM